VKLYAWQPQGHGELSWFVVAESEAQARASVETEITRRKALPIGDLDRVTEYECGGWGTDYYSLTVAEPGAVLTNGNN
jgi:hypothetical protein